jgi:hypothetical protein
MKKVMSFALFLVICLSVHAQPSEVVILKKHELKLDVAYILLATAKLEYEYLPNDWSSLGVVAFVNFPAGIFNDNEPLFKTQLLGFYRLYFGYKPSAGIFLEGNAGMTSGYWSNYMKTENGKYLAPSAGIALGWKYASRSNFVMDIFLGLGNIFGEYSGPGMYPRLGICLGKRF